MEKNTPAIDPGKPITPGGSPATWTVGAGLGIALTGAGLLAPGSPYPWVHAGGGLLLVAAGALLLRSRGRNLRRHTAWREGQRQSAAGDLEHYLSILPGGAMVIDPLGGVRTCNRKALDLLGWSEEDLRRVDWAAPGIQVLKVDGNTLEPEELPMNIARATGRRVPGVVLGIERPADGDWAWVTCSAYPKCDPKGTVLEVICTLEDATQRRTAETELAVQTFRDRLTGLPNRTLFMERLAQAILRSDRRRLYSAVLFLDLDRFKVVNDSLGHEAGDQLLQKVARRLMGCIRPEDTVARLGGDEFVVLFEDIQSVNDGISVADRIAQSHAHPYHLQGQEVFVSCSMGIALSSGGDTAPSDLIRDAEVAMYRAKANGERSIEVFDPSMNAQAMARFQMETELRQGLERGEFVLHYQPVVGLHRGVIEGWEALVRWQHPERGLIPPLEFIPLAEETGLIVPLGKWVLEAACRQAGHWARAFPSEVPRLMNVNLSARQFGRSELIAEVSNALAQSGLDPRNLKLELTESVMMHDPLASLEVMKVFLDMNIHLVVDDFGTGYSSLSYLKRFPVDTLKIDKSFVDGIGKDPESTAIVTAIVSLAQSLGMKVTAEGIETHEQMEYLQSLNCEQGQGYYFSRPLPAEAAEAILSRNPVW
jgi:diguanylate cyclase (GGDEF)-like protein/PAS domain S-box-containing protein